MNAATATRDTTRLTFESLMTTDEEFKTVPMLEDSVDVSDDDKIYVPFHNGEEMVAGPRWNTD